MLNWKILKFHSDTGCKKDGYYLKSHLEDLFLL